MEALKNCDVSAMCHIEAVLPPKTECRASHPLRRGAAPEESMQEEEGYIPAMGCWPSTLSAINMVRSNRLSQLRELVLEELEVDVKTNEMSTARRDEIFGPGELSLRSTRVEYSLNTTTIKTITLPNVTPVNLSALDALSRLNSSCMIPVLDESPESVGILVVLAEALNLKLVTETLYAQYLTVVYCPGLGGFSQTPFTANRTAAVRDCRSKN
ncbi:hypothetical protein BC629DRAFT_1439701 [Irpex lacteus]|nr:hypothetical protein BC629DRAFT_1439701 [Irpex lacteus]